MNAESIEIVKVPGICGGRATFKGTRSTIWHLIAELETGMTEEEYLTHFPHKTREHIRAAREYYDRHQAEIRKDIAENGE